MQGVLRLLLAAGAGALAYLSYEPHGLWWAGVLAMALLFGALAPWGSARPGVWTGAGLGLVQALVCYLLLLPWIGEFVGAMPYVALSVFLALYALATGAFGTLVARWRYGFAAFALVYVAVEFCRSSFPFGGFAWVRLAWGQIGGPLGNLAHFGGPALVTLAVVLAGAGLAALVVAHGRARAAGAVAVVAPLVLGLAASAAVNTPAHEVGTARAATVQGNVPRLGLDFNAQRRAVLSNHVEETKRLAQDAKDQGQPLDLVIWPENASDVNPFTDPEAGALVKEAAAAVGVPVLVGTLTRDQVGERNTMVVINPDGSVGERHNKRFLQPFGEYMPMRDFFRNFSDMVDLAGDFKPGDGPGVVRMGTTVVGVATCYEVAEDPAYRMAVRNGAQLLATPTNNATFGFTDMTYQQLAMSRMRAIETDRAVVVAATSGVSAIVHPDGSVSQQSEIFQAAHLQEELPLKDSITPAVRFGQWLEWLLVLGGAAVALGAVARPKRDYAAKSPAEKERMA